MSYPQQAEVELETRTIFVWECDCESFRVELDSEADPPRCGNCGSYDVGVVRTFLRDVEVEVV